MNTKSALLDEAETLARQRGFDGFSFGDLEAAVGIRKASIHYHFPSKGALSYALLDRYRSVFLDRLAAISVAQPRASGRLLAFVDLYRQALGGGHSLCLCVALSVTQFALPADSKDALDAFHRDVTAWLETVFRLGAEDGSIRSLTDPLSEARGALAQAEGAQVVGRATSDPARFEAAIASLISRAI